MGFLEELFNPKLTAERRLAREGESMNQPVMANQQLPGQGVNVPPAGAPPGQNSLSTMPSVPAGMTLAQFQAQQAAEQQKKMEIAKAMAAMQAQGGSPGAVAQPMPAKPPLRVPYNAPR